MKPADSAVRHELTKSRQLSPRGVKPKSPCTRVRSHTAAGLLACGLVVLAGCASSSEGSAARGNSRANPAAAPPGTAARVISVVDGDTVEVQVAGRTELVRLIGIDTPEVDGGFLPAECYGEEASSFTRSLIPEGAEVRVTRDIEARDRYGRLLAYLHRADDGLFVNLEIAARGYADALIIAPNATHAGAFHSAVATARDQGLGLWSVCGSADVVLQ